MSEYYADPDAPLDYYKLTNSGEIYEIDSSFCEWGDVSEYVDYSPRWTPTDENTIKVLKLVNYINKSKDYYKKNPNKLLPIASELGKDFNFYAVGKDCYALNDKDVVYKCNKDLMVPLSGSKDNLLDGAFVITYPDAYNFISNQDCIFMSDMELYYDNDGNIQGFTKDLHQFCLNVKTGMLSEVFDDIGIDPSWKECSFYTDPIFDKDNLQLGLRREDYENLSKLHDYIVKSETDYKKENQKEPFGTSFTYFANFFGQVIAKDENGRYYNCNYDFMKPNEDEIILEEFTELNRYYVIDFIKKYEENSKAPKNNKVFIKNLITLKSTSGDICCINEDGNVFSLSKETGELNLIESLPEDVEWYYINKIEALKAQGIYKYNYTHKDSE